MAPGVCDKGVRRPEAHGLRIEQCCEERGRVVQPQPRAHIYEVGKGHRVALGEAEVGECRQLLPDGVHDLAGDPPFGHPCIKAGAETFHTRSGAFRAHGLTELVGLGRRETGGIDRHLHELFLEQRHPEGLCQTVLETRMQVRHRLCPVAPAQVGMNRSSLDRAGADEGDLDDEVVKAAWP